MSSRWLANQALSYRLRAISNLSARTENSLSVLSKVYSGDFVMDAETKKKVLIAIIAVCTSIAIVMTIVNIRRGSGDYGAQGSMQVLCTNEDCGKD